MKYKHVLFICSANRCRSPLAATIFKSLAAKAAAYVSVEVRSAGTLEYIGGATATDEARMVMTERGLDLSSHAARHVSRDLVDWADIILVMEYEHRDYLAKRFSDSVGKVHLLTEFAGEPGEVPDPVNQGIEKYRRCADLLESLLGAALKRLNKR